MSLETKPQPKYALLTFGEYFKLNHDLSVAKGWQLGQPTERCEEMNPPKALLNETVVYPMLISTDVQENYPDLITGLTLYTKDEVQWDDSAEDVIADATIATDVIDWTLNHYQRFGIENEKLRTYIAGQDSTIYPIIPAEGEWCEAKVYSYNGDKARCIQPHIRTHRTPEEEPALWTVIKTVSNYDDVEVWDGNNWLAYQTVGYLVKYNNKIWASKLPISHTWIAPALEGNGAISWEFVADI